MPVKNYFFTWPGGCRKAVSMSYDDGQIHDRRLVEIFNRYHIRGTFHLSSAFIDLDDRFISSTEIPDLYAGHEVACHSALHIPFKNLASEVVRNAILTDRALLERIVRKPVLGFAYPGGTATPETIELTRQTGVIYARTCMPSHSRDIPSDLFFWHPSYRHDNDLPEQAAEYVSEQGGMRSLFMVAGHSYEFHDANNWELMESTCKVLSGKSDIWYATMAEIADYENRIRGLKFSLDTSIIRNDYAEPVWVCCDKKVIEIPGGQTVCLYD